MGLIFLSIQLPYVFWLEHLNCLCLRWLLIDIYVVCIHFIVRLFSSFSFLSLFLLLLKASPSMCVAILVWC